MRASTSAKLKALEQRLAKARAVLPNLDEQRKETASEYDRALNRVHELERQIADLKRNTPEPVVSEHALLRYLERVKGVDLDAIRFEILEGRRGVIKTMKTGKIKADGYKLVVRDYTVVSVTDD